MPTRKHIFQRNNEDVIFHIELHSFDGGIGNYEFWGAIYYDSFLTAEIINTISDPPGFDLTESEEEIVIQQFLSEEWE